MSPQPNNKIDTAIEEWPENQTFASAWRLAPAEPTPKEVEVNNSLSAKDLKSLKKRDPFLYYSIPGVRDAARCHPPDGTRRRRRHASSGSKWPPEALPNLPSNHGNFIYKSARH